MAGNFGGFAEFFKKGKTFRPKKKFMPGTLKYSLHKQAQASLNAGMNLRRAVKLPIGEDIHDWIAVHVVDFFNRINLIYGTVCDFCTVESCPTMSGGQKFEYLWRDGAKFKKPTRLPAPKYIALLMDWIELQINNEDIFPSKMDVPFPKSFPSLCEKILTRLFRVFVHVYIHHFDRIFSIGAEPHVNTCYKHFYYFITEFHLVSTKELEPLKDMTCRICHDPPIEENEQQMRALANRHLDQMTAPQQPHPGSFSPLRSTYSSPSPAASPSKKSVGASSSVFH